MLRSTKMAEKKRSDKDILKLAAKILVYLVFIFRMKKLKKKFFKIEIKVFQYEATSKES